jgi:hypothetical protein
MLLNIVFSYNRAMQLDCFLDSFIKHSKYPDYKVAVVYHTSGNHNLGYKLLQEKYKNNSYIIFYERSDVKNYFFKILPLLFYPRNLYRYFKYEFLRKNVDNFKFLVEDIIKNSKCDFIMFSTDDTFYDNDFDLSDIILKKIKENPYQVSYRLCLGENISNDENVNTLKIEESISWNYYEKKGIKYWGYPFIVDGTIYYTDVVLNIVKKLLYHMPGTLESFVNTYVIRKNYFSLGICPPISCLSNIWLNRVQPLGGHNSLNIDVEMLNEKYIEGYLIEYKYKKPVQDWGTIPDEVFLINNNKKIMIYDGLIK